MRMWILKKKYLKKLKINLFLQKTNLFQKFTIFFSQKLTNLFQIQSWIQFVQPPQNHTILNKFEVFITT